MEVYFMKFEIKAVLCVEIPPAR